jgi:hypothetical protein
MTRLFFYFFSFPLPHLSRFFCFTFVLSCHESSLRFKVTLDAQTAALQHQGESPSTYLNKGKQKKREHRAQLNLVLLLRLN